MHPIRMATTVSTSIAPVSSGTTSMGNSVVVGMLQLVTQRLNHQVLPMLRAVVLLMLHDESSRSSFPLKREVIRLLTLMSHTT